MICTYMCFHHNKWCKVTFSIYKSTRSQSREADVKTEFYFYKKKENTPKHRLGSEFGDITIYFYK